MPARKRRVVVVSNRLPVTARRTPGGIELARSPGGLVTALDPVLRAEGGTWIGWPGVELAEGEALPVGDLPYRLEPIPLTREEVRGYYHGLSNRTLWPLLHSLVESSRFEGECWATYEEVNARFARATAEVSRTDDLVWIHDYHLMRLPCFLRRAGFEGRLAFFLHVPFPSYDIFRLLPWDRDILRSLLSCDLVGFHVESFARNFMDCAERLLGARVDRAAWVVEHGDRTARVGAFPIGIDFRLFEDRARRPRPADQRLHRKKVVLGVDRLDYTKGIPERIRSIERLLERYPEHREAVTLLQIAVPSRAEVAEYRDLKRAIDEEVGRVNGRFGTERWVPIHYLYRSFDQDQLACLYRDADVALVTPLRDGMNLVAKEYVACQVDDPGVLVLSRLAGAAETMHEAILVNPYDVDGTAVGLHRALTMPESERRSRMTALRSREQRNDVYAWLDGYLHAAEAGPAALHLPTDADFEVWFGSLHGDHRLALCLDYEGTIAPPSPRRPTVPEPRIVASLASLAASGRVDVAILSHRSLTDLRAAIGLSGVAYAGAGGLEIEGAGLACFRHEDLDHFQGKTAEVAAQLERSVGADVRIERRGPTLAVHHIEAPVLRRREVVDRVRRIVAESGCLMR